MDVCVGGGRRVGGGLGRRALKRLRGSGMAIEEAIDELMNDIAVLGRDVTLVLDDLNTVTSPECLASVVYAVERLPVTARMILITRADPTLGLARWRARGELVELRVNELAFTVAEARELLVDRAGLRLGNEQIETLVRRTEGWPAALYLAALWLRSVDDLDRAVVEFGGEHRYVAEYLSYEVLEALDADRRSFLLRAAVLGGFTAELCDAALGRTDSAAVLAELEESNMFVQHLERGEWFRSSPFVCGVRRRPAGRRRTLVRSSRSIAGRRRRCDREVCTWRRPRTRLWPAITKSSPRR